MPVGSNEVGIAADAMVEVAADAMVEVAAATVPVGGLTYELIPGC